MLDPRFLSKLNEFGLNRALAVKSSRHTISIERKISFAKYLDLG